MYFQHPKHGAGHGLVFSVDQWSLIDVCDRFEAGPSEVGANTATLSPLPLDIYVRHCFHLSHSSFHFTVLRPSLFRSLHALHLVWLSVRLFVCPVPVHNSKIKKDYLPTHKASAQDYNERAPIVAGLHVHVASRHRTLIFSYPGVSYPRRL